MQKQFFSSTGGTNILNSCESATSLNENNKNGIPMRWLYPAAEANYNRENLEEALNRQYDGYDEINKIMWILK